MFLKIFRIREVIPQININMFSNKTEMDSGLQDLHKLSNMCVIYMYGQQIIAHP
jgi:hypothetical protein